MTIDHGSTALTQAAYFGSSSCVNMLLQAGANVNATDNEGHTALFISSTQAHVSCTAILLQAGARVNIRDKSGTTALFAAVNGWICLGYVYDGLMLIRRLESTKLLLQAGAKINLVDVENMNVLCSLIDISKYEKCSPDKTMVLLL